MVGVSRYSIIILPYVIFTRKGSIMFVLYEYCRLDCIIYCCDVKYPDVLMHCGRGSSCTGLF